MVRSSGRPAGPHSQAGQSTATVRLFIAPGGTLISSRVISPRVTASRWWQSTSRCQPGTKRRPGSSSRQA